MSNSALDAMVGRVRQMLHNGEQQVTFTRETASMLVAGVEKLQRQLSAEQEAHAATIQREAKLSLQLDEAEKQEPIAWTSTGQLKNAKKLEEGSFWLKFDENFAEQAQEIGSKTIQIPLYRLPPNIAAIIEQAKVEEREACARVCDDYSEDYGAGMFDKSASACADAIRARKP